MESGRSIQNHRVMEFLNKIQWKTVMKSPIAYRFKKLQTSPSTLKDCDEISLGTICQMTHPSLYIYIYIRLFDVFFDFSKILVYIFFSDLQVHFYIFTYVHIYTLVKIFKPEHFLQ